MGDFVFVDEMGINIDLTREYGRAAPGERVVDTKPSARGDNLSVIAALGFDELRAAMSVPGAVDGDACLVFTKDVLAPRLPGISCFWTMSRHTRWQRLKKPSPRSMPR